MTQDTVVRTQIAALIFVMTNAVLFGAGLIGVLMIPALNAHAGFWIAMVVAFSVIVAAPAAWLIAPRLRARYWRKTSQTKTPPTLTSVPTRAF